MAKATRTAIVAARYFLTPLAVYIGLVAIGTFTGYLFLTNFTILILSLLGAFAALFFSLRWKSHTKALALFCSVSLINIWVWNFGEDPIRHYVYVAEVLITPHFDRKCFPSDGVLLNGDVLRLCGTHAFGEYVDLIFKITGSYPKERLIDDVNAGNINAAARSELMKLGGWTFVFAWPHSVTGQHLFYDYYLIRHHMCGNADPYC